MRRMSTHEEHPVGAPESFEELCARARRECGEHDVLLSLLADKLAAELRGRVAVGRDPVCHGRFRTPSRGRVRAIRVELPSARYLLRAAPLGIEAETDDGTGWRRVGVEEWLAALKAGAAELARAAHADRAALEAALA